MLQALIIRIRAKGRFFQGKKMKIKALLIFLIIRECKIIQEILI